VGKPRKRGRPTREEVEERDRLLAITGQVYAPKRRPFKKPRPSETPQSPSEDPLRVSPDLHTPSAQRTEVAEEVSSRERWSKQGREGEVAVGYAGPAGSRSAADDSGNELSTEAAQSPSDRLLHKSNERAQTWSMLGKESHQGQSPLGQTSEMLQNLSPSAPPSK
jgi:hypothetical protein